MKPDDTAARGALRQLPLEFPGGEGGSRTTTPLGSCLVTGGAGYLGRQLAAELLQRGLSVRVFDLRAPAPPLPGADVVLGDIARIEDVRRACSGVDTIFHTAAILDWSRWPTPAQRERSVGVNVRGVENLVRAARETGAARLVHTSSNNVTLDGPVVDGDETRPYAARTRDLYTETKIRGERIALGANGEGIATCALRPGGIYGPDDPTILPALVRNLAAGRYLATFGPRAARSDNIYVLNLVDAEIEAARHLLPASPLAGQAYFVTDGQPINYWEFFRPFVESVGVRQPRLNLPGGFVHAIVTAWELAHAKLGVPPPPLLSLEVRKVAISHFNRIDRARRDFGWTPKISPAEALPPCIAYVRRLMSEREAVDRPHWAWWVAILAGMTLTGALALSGAAYGWFAANVTSLLPRPLIGAIFGWACWLHVRKGLRAVQLAERAGLHETSLAWGWQTFLLGFASLSLLERCIARREAAAREPEAPRA
ncbi:MAG TPA: NAD-dependent epimerase/dehydratase family protein [Myxococcota bacterium]|jgi:3beta-hydroxy-delta5-steroid dehydrogenase/steroid delta-isomerase